MLATPVTRAPSVFAIWTTFVPTPPAGADHEHRHAGADARQAQRLDRRVPGDGKRRGLLERETRGLADEQVRLGDRELGERAARHAQHLVTDLRRW